MRALAFIHSTCFAHFTLPTLLQLFNYFWASRKLVTILTRKFDYFPWTNTLPAACENLPPQANSWRINIQLHTTTAKIWPLNCTPISCTFLFDMGSHPGGVTCSKMTGRKEYGRERDRERERVCSIGQCYAFIEWALTVTTAKYTPQH